MNSKLVIFLVVLATIQACLSEKIVYKNHKLVLVTPNSDEQTRLIEKWSENLDFDIWSGVKGVGNSISVFFTPFAFKKYQALFEMHQVEHNVLQEDFQKVLDEEERQIAEARKNEKATGRNSVLLKYAKYADIMSYLDEVVEENPDIAETYVAGTTHEKRQLKVILINGGKNRKGIWLDCGIHAREWISPATCTWFINQLIKDYRDNNPTVKTFFNTYEFHILPIVNPDGYEYTHSTSRLWRKNRAPNAGSTCVGTDLNRNFDHKWMFSGSSNSPCADTFAGSSAGSELETKAIKQAINKKLNNWEVFFTLHSYGQYWMFPYAFPTSPADNSPYYNLLKAKSTIGANALKAHSGTTYKIGTVPELLYSASGGSFDWTHAVANIKHSYCLELRPDGNALNGFVLAEQYIKPTVEESYLGMIALIESIRTSPDN